MKKWDKKGLLVEKCQGDFSHASHPTAIKLDDTKYLLAYCGRDEKQHSHVFFRTFHIENSQIYLNNDERLAISPGKLGTFDSHGVLTCNFVRDKSQIFLYYCGWLNIDGGLWHCDTGRAVVDCVTLEANREFHGPIMGRSKDIPLYAVATAVMKENDNWISWYNRGISWEYDYEGLKPKYGIHFATSKNGVEWDCGDELIIPFSDRYEHSFGRPTVIFFEGKYLMWFASRGGGQDPRYRIGFALSNDKKNWKRLDDYSGIYPSGSGWESDAVAYPFVFEHDSDFYLLYNGNDYGRSGFGYASITKENLANNLIEIQMEASHD